MGFVMGLIIGILAGYDVKGVRLAVKTAAVLLMPRVIKPIMDGLTPITKQARSRLQAKFGGQEFLIGLDPALLLGHTAVVSARSLIFYPTHHFNCCLCVPGNPGAAVWRSCRHRLLRGDGGRRASWKSVPHLNLRCHHYEHHPVDRDTKLLVCTPSAANAGALRRGMSGFNGSGGSPITVTDSGFSPRKIFPVSLLSVQFI